jgi:endonuclease YncB( thermonuclease family)
MRRKNNVTPFSRDYRRPPRWSMVPAPPPPGRLRRWLRRMADPRFYLRAVIVVASVGLLVLPLGADAVNALARPVAGPDGHCRILSVVDGDTVSLWCHAGGLKRARLTGFDAPELYSPGCISELIAAQRATWALRWMIFQADTRRIVPKGRDRYDRALVEIWVDGVPIATRMVADGHARAYAGGKRGGWCGA